MRVNNAVRGAVEAALGSLRLFAPDASTARCDAAEAVFHSHDPAALPALERALAQGDRRRREAPHGAGARRGAAVRRRRSEADRLAAVAVLRERGDIDSRSLLASLSRPDAGRSRRPPPPRSPRSTATCSSGASLQSVYYGLSLGSVLLLAAAGLAITFGVMGVINMAHGEMVMIGAYVTFVVQQVIRDAAPGLFGASLLVAVPLAFIVAGLIGIAIERTLIRWLYGRPLETLLATWGLSLVLQQAVRSIFGAEQPRRRHARLDERCHRNSAA